MTVPPRFVLVRHGYTGCFGADSADGNTFVATILTVSATCHQQKRHLLTYLTDAVSA